MLVLSRQPCLVVVLSKTPVQVILPVNGQMLGAQVGARRGGDIPVVELALGTLDLDFLTDGEEREVARNVAFLVGLKS